MADEKMKPVVTNNDIKVKKKSKAENFMANFISDLIVNVFFPSIERTITSLVSDTFDVSKRAILSSMRFNDKAPANDKQINGNPTRISYNDYYNRWSNGGPGTFTPVVNDLPYNEITFNSIPKAELVLANLTDILRRNKVVTVGDYYAICGIQTSPTDFNFGWIDLSAVRVIMTAGGYKIKLPKAMPIDR